jgi:hypothetical protein
MIPRSFDAAAKGVPYIIDDLGISHPCTTFDEWRVISVVDDTYNVVDVITTRF